MAPIHARAPMGDALHRAIVKIAAREGEQGIPMGALVDEMVAEGHAEEPVELAIWTLMEQRQLVPSGFVARIVRKRGRDGALIHQRTYEIMLALSAEDDRQLDLLGKAR